MGISIDRSPGQLPRRFPVGATYVIEGYGGEEGKLRVIARYVVLPGGRRINVPADLSTSAAPRALGFPAPGERQAIRTQKSAAKPHKEICGPARNRLARLGVD